jgi:NAD(P)-dependent dehydrogenase (short-subunit alcohol dehydrogenase family)
VHEFERVAVVTGAGSGIGRAVAQSLLEAGYRVALAGRRDDALYDTVGGADAAPSDSLVVPTDVTDPHAVRALFAGVTATWGRVDVLFNNAGTFGHPAPIDEFADAEWRTVIDSNLTGSFFCAPRGLSHDEGTETSGRTHH